MSTEVAAQLSARIDSAEATVAVIGLGLRRTATCGGSAFRRLQGHWLRRRPVKDRVSRKR